MSLFDTCVGAWKLDDGSDSTGRGNNLTNNNGVTFNTGRVNNAAYFSSSSLQFLSLVNNTDVGRGDSSFSISLFVWINSTGTNQSLVAKDDEDSSHRDYRIAVNSDATVSFFVYHTGGSTDFVTTTTTITAGSWNHIVVWHNATSDQIGVVINNGTPVTGSSGGALSAASAAKFTFGCRDTAGGPQFLDGRLDAVHLFSNQISSQDITDLYNGGNGLEFFVATLLGTGPSLLRGRSFTFFDDEEINRFEFWLPASGDSTSPSIVFVFGGR